MQLQCGLKRAKEIVDGEVMPMHLYMFDSELDSSITAQSGGAWIGTIAMTVSDAQEVEDITITTVDYFD